MLLNDPEMQILNNLTGYISRSCRYFRCFEMVEQNYTLSCEEGGGEREESGFSVILFCIFQHGLSSLVFRYWYLVLSGRLVSGGAWIPPVVFIGLFLTHFFAPH